MNIDTFWKSVFKHTICDLFEGNVLENYIKQDNLFVYLKDGNFLIFEVLEWYTHFVIPHNIKYLFVVENKDLEEKIRNKDIEFNPFECHLFTPEVFHKIRYALAGSKTYINIYNGKPEKSIVNARFRLKNKLQVKNIYIDVYCKN